MSDPRVIKKYPNRRLYDTVESRYITLGDVRRLVVEKIDFVVVDKKNNADITRSILLQVIAEQEHLPEPILTQEFMVSVIRSYGSNLQNEVSGHLEQSLKSFLSENPQVRERAKPAVNAAEPARARPPEEGFKPSMAAPPPRIRENEKEREETNVTK
jgi:polyhydroxyalkanoate synthesis repressor PhaR